MTQSLNIHQRIAAVMGEVTYIQKEKRNGMNYSIVSHDVVTAKVRPALLKAGVVYYPIRCDHTHNGNRAECSMTVRFANIDNPDDFIDVQTFGYGIDQQDKGPGKAQSYAVKYALLKTLGLETGDDADHDDVAHEDHDPARPDPREIARLKANMLGAVNGSPDMSQLSAVEGDEKFDADLQRLREMDGSAAQEVVDAVNAKKQSFKPKAA